MLAIDAKRGIESATQKVFQSSGRRFDSFKMYWHGNTAKVTFDGSKAIIVLPALDETKEVSKKMFNDLIGYVLHELGHVWFTTNSDWDIATIDYGTYVGHLINGLEDPRIEYKVIESGYAPNSRDLFNALINNVIEKNGYPTKLDKQSLPFILAVEGRRLNGYVVDVPDVFSHTPFAEHIGWALDCAHSARNTKRIAEIAIELYKRLFSDEPFEEDKPRGKGKGSDGQDDEPTDPQDESEGDGKGKSKEVVGGSGGGEKFPDSGKKIRDPDVNDYVSEESKPLKCGADERRHRPVLNSVEVAEFNFYGE